MNEKRSAALKVVSEMLSPEAASYMDNASKAGGFCSELSDLAIENVFGNIWTRPGLGRRERSLVTLGILIALRAEGELKFHFPIALTNGLTKDEIAEVIYQASGYAGFPAASLASKVAADVFAMSEIKVPDPSKR